MANLTRYVPGANYQLSRTVDGGAYKLNVDCCCPVCTCAGYSALAIVGYSDGDLTACADCDDRADGPWDGTFARTAAEPTCLYEGGGLSVSGKDKYLARIERIDTSPCEWQMVISCLDTTGSTEPRVIWGGRLTALTPVGTYARIEGCDTTATLDVG